MPADAHADYLAFQRRLARRIASEVGDEVGRLRGRLKEYYLDYLRDVSNYERVATKDELVRKVLASDVVLGGDYHSLDQAKKTHLRILRKVARRRRDLVLALECFGSNHQSALNSYLSGSIGEATLLARANYREEWGFEWRPYRELLELAREQGLRVVAANMPAAERRAGVEARDRHMASIVARAAGRGLVYLVVGDWHLARDHLPRTVTEALGGQRKILVIYQNSEAIYWKLASRGIEQATDVVLVRPGAYCVVNATPFVKLASYALWAGRHEEAWELASEGMMASAPSSVPWLDEEGDEADDVAPESDLSDTISMFARAIAEFFELETPIDFTLFTPSEENLVQRLLKEISSASPDFLHEVAVLMYYRRSFYIPELRAIYLASASLNHMADMASLYLYHTLSRADALPDEGPRAFYVRVLRETVTFLGSKIINHKRPYRRRRDYEQVMRQGRGRKLLGPARERVLIARQYLAHRAIEKRVLAGRRPPPATSRIYHLRPVIRWGLTRSLGQALGHKLYDGMVLGRVDKQALRALYSENWAAWRDPFTRYIELVRETRRIAASVKEREERL